MNAIKMYHVIYYLSEFLNETGQNQINFSQIKCPYLLMKLNIGSVSHKSQVTVLIIAIWSLSGGWLALVLLYFSLYSDPEVWDG